MKHKPFDKHFYYTQSVQSADHDAALLREMFRKRWPGKNPANIMLREDFCGTGALCYEWVKLSPKHTAWGIDLDSQALAWGENNLAPDLSAVQRRKVKLLCTDVLHLQKERSHIICALNFSYFILRDRTQFKRYLSACLTGLTADGILVLDCFGGPEYQQPHLDRRRNKEQKFTYWWEVKTFDAISNRLQCNIHYQRDGEKRRDNVFQYDWRMWSIPEITDLLKEIGFKQIEFWAESLDRDGYGNGKFKTVTQESDCETWVVYIVASK